jgi:hypothetical protein
MREIRERSIIRGRYLLEATNGEIREGEMSKRERA